MYIVVLGWLYVVMLMAAASKTLASGLLIFVMLGILPSALALYLGGWRVRRKSVLADQQPHAADGKDAQGD